MRQLFLLSALIAQSFWQLAVNAASQPGDAFDHVKMEYIPEGTRWLEVGFFLITPDDFTTVQTTYNNFVDPVVFLSLPQLAGDTSQEGVAQSLRVQNTNLDRIDASTSYYSFEAKIYNVNTTYCSTRSFYTPRDLQVNSSFIGWLVVEKGKFNVSGDGFIIQTDTINRTNSDVRDDLRNQFRSFAPKGICDGGQDCAMTGVEPQNLLTIGQIQSLRYDRYLLLRAIEINISSVVWVLQPHDSLDPLGYYFPDPGEDYAWMMFERGIQTTCVEDLAIESYKYFVTNLKLTVNYVNTFLIPPALFGMVNTLKGRDSVSLRMFDLTTTGASFITQEDKCAKEETDHVFEEESGVLIVGRITSIGTTVCGATFNDNQPTRFPTAAPTPGNDTFCVEVTLYDTFGDGWGDNVALQVWGPEFETQYIYYDCPNEFPQVICFPADADVYFDIVTFDPPAVETWEMFWTIRTIGQPGSIYDENGDVFVPQFYLGDYDTNMTVFNTQVDVFNPVDTSDQTCERCKHPPKPSPKAASSSSKSSDSESESSAGKSAPKFRELRGSHNSTESEYSYSEVSNSSYHESSEGPGAGGKPKPPHWPFPVTIFDESGAGWFNGSEAWVMVPEYECDGSVSYSDNRRLPEVVTNPEYVISTLDRTKVLRRNTICGDLLRETCEERLPDGEYIFRVGGALSRDHTANNSAWDFCGVRGRSMEELAFSMRKGKCNPGLRVTASELCCSDTLITSFFSGEIILSNVAGDGLTSYDTNLLENILGEAFTKVHTNLYSSVSVTSWERQGSALIVDFRLSIDPSMLGIAPNDYISLSSLADDLFSSAEGFIGGGSFIGALRTGLMAAPLTNADVLDATDGATLTSLQYVDVAHDFVHSMSVHIETASADASFAANGASESEVVLVSFKHKLVVASVSFVGSLFVLAIFGVFSRGQSHPMGALPSDSEDDELLSQTQSRDDFELIPELAPDLLH